MPLEIYEIVAGAARYWFLFLMVLIVFRSFRWYRKDQKQQKKQLRLMPDAGYIGEMVVVQGQEGLEAGTTLPVPWEGVLGYTRFSDICLPVEDVAKKHCWFRYEEGEGLVLEPLRTKSVQVDGILCQGTKEPAVMGHGSWLQIGSIVMRLRMFSGYETKAPQPYAEEAPDQQRNAQPMACPPQGHYPSQEQYALWRQQMELERQRQMLAQQQMAWMQWQAHQQQLARQQAAAVQQCSAEREENMPEGAYRPSSQIEFEHEETFYPLEMDEEEEALQEEWQGEEDSPSEEELYGDFQPCDEDMTDAALPPRSVYVGEDESRRARQVLDKYLGGGGAK